MWERVSHDVNFANGVKYNTIHYNNLSDKSSFFKTLRVSKNGLQLEVKSLEVLTCNPEALSMVYKLIEDYAPMPYLMENFCLDFYDNKNNRLSINTIEGAQAAMKLIKTLIEYKIIPKELYPAIMNDLEIIPVVRRGFNRGAAAGFFRPLGLASEIGMNIGEHLDNKTANALSRCNKRIYDAALDVENEIIDITYPMETRHFEM